MLGRSKLLLGKYGRGGLKRPPYWDDIIQYLTGKTKVNPDNGYTELIDAKGKRDGVIQEGRAYLFDGIDDYVDFGTGLPFEIGDTLEMTVDMSYFATGNHYFIGFSQSSHGIRYSGDSSSFLLYNGVISPVSWVNTNEVIDFKVKRLTATTHEFFVDGVSIGTSTNSDTEIKILSIGSEDLTFTNALIGNVKLYAPDNKLLHSYHCDEGGGAVSYDSVKEWLGDDLVVNGGFDTDTDWTKGTNITISNGKLNFDSTPNAQDAHQNGILTSGKRYRLQYTVSDYVAGSLNIQVGGGTVGILRSANGTYVEEVTADGVRLYVQAIGVATFKIDNVSVQEIHSPAHGTIHNADLNTFHAIDNNFKSYQNEVGYSEEVPSEELVINGGFDTDSSWAKETGWTISDGKANCDGTSGNMTQGHSGFTTYIGNKYLVKIDVPTLTSGSLKVYINGTDRIAEITSAGSYSEIITSTLETVQTFYLVSANFQGTLDNFSVKEITPEGQLIPIALSESGVSTREDIFGNEPTYNGLVRRNAKLVNNSVAVFDGVDDLIDTGSDFIGTKAVTIAGWINPYSTGEGSTGTIIDNGKFHLGMYPPSNLFIQSDNTVNKYSGSIIFNKPQFVSVTRETDGIVNFYIGDKTTAPTLSGVADQASGTPVAGTTNVIIGNNLAGTRTFDGAIGGLKVYEGIATPAQITDIWNNKEISLQGITDYNFAEGAGTTVYDKVPAWYGDDLITNGGFDTDSDWDIDGETTISGGVARILSTAGVYSKVSQSSVFVIGKRYMVNYEVLATSGQNLYNNLATITWDASTTGKKSQIITATESILEFKRISACDITIDNISVKEIHEPINGTINNASLDTFWGHDDFARANNYLDGFTEGLYCKTAGTSYHPSEQAYGTWEFDVRKGGDGNEIRIPIINQLIGSYPDVDGYAFNVESQESLRLYKISSTPSAATLFSTPASYISINTDYRIKVTRTGDGEFTVYIKGGDFGDDYILVDVTGGSGTNPVTDNTYTTSNYFVADLDAGDTLSNIKLDTKINTFDFVSGTGVYNKLYIPAQVGNGKDVFGSLLTNPAKKWHNNAGSLIEQYKQPAMKLVDSIIATGEGGDGYWYDAAGEPVRVGHADRQFNVYEGNNYNLIFSNATENEWHDIITYGTEQAAEKIDLFTKGIERLYDEDGAVSNLDGAVYVYTEERGKLNP